MDEQSLKSNSVTEDFFKIGIKCISLCKTEFVEELTPQQKFCLGNFCSLTSETCGYNRAYIIHNVKDLIEKTVNLGQ